MNTFGNFVFVSVALFLGFSFWCCLRINKNENDYEDIQVNENTTLEELVYLYDTYGANIEINNGKITRVNRR